MQTQKGKACAIGLASLRQRGGVAGISTFPTSPSIPHQPAPQRQPQRVLRVAARREPQAVRLDAHPPQQPQHLPGPPQPGRVHAPRQDHALALPDGRLDVPVVVAPHGVARPPQFRGVRRDVRVEVDDLERAVAEAPGEPDAAPDGRVLAGLVGGARVQQDEAHCRPVPPPAPEAVPEAAVAGEQGGAVHRTPIFRSCCGPCPHHVPRDDPHGLTGGGKVGAMRILAATKGGEAGEGGETSPRTAFAAFTGFRRARARYFPCARASLDCWKVHAGRSLRLGQGS